MAEQFAFEQRFGNGGAVDADVMRLAPQAQAVQRARDQFLAGAAFAENEHPRVGGGNGLNQFPQFAHFRRFADDLVEAENFAGARAQRGIFPQELMAFGAARDRVEQFLRRERFGEIINRAGLDGFDGELGRRVGGEHEHRQFRPLLADFGQKIVAAHAAQARVGDDHEKFLAREQLQPFLGGFHRRARHSPRRPAPSAATGACSSRRPRRGQVAGQRSFLEFHQRLCRKD